MNNLNNILLQDEQQNNDEDGVLTLKSSPEKIAASLVKNGIIVFENLMRGYVGKMNPIGEEVRYEREGRLGGDHSSDYGTIEMTYRKDVFCHNLDNLFKAMDLLPRDIREELEKCKDYDRFRRAKYFADNHRLI